LKDTVLRSPGIRSGFYRRMSDLAIFYVGYGLPHRVLNTGSQPLYNLLAGSYQYSRLSIESEIRVLRRTVLHRSSFDIFNSCSDVASPHVCHFFLSNTLLLLNCCSSVVFIHFPVKYSCLIQWKIETTYPFFKKSSSNQSYRSYGP
jgi:hypothetical protein